MRSVTEGIDMNCYVSYENEYYELSTVHVRGTARKLQLDWKAETDLGQKLMSAVSNQLPDREPVSNEFLRLTRRGPLQCVRELAQITQKNGLHLLGILSYEAAFLFDDLTMPEGAFFEFLICELNLKPQTQLNKMSQSHPVNIETSEISDTPKILDNPKTSKLPKPFITLKNDTSAQFSEQFKKAREHFEKGDIFEIVLSRQFKFNADKKQIRDFLAQTMEHRFAPYRFVLDFPLHTIVGASPELLVNIEGRKVTTRPISGSMRRQGKESRTLSEQEILEFEELLKSEKEKSELDMLIDLARHDLHRVCENVTVSQYREALVLETVAHTQATVTGTLKSEYNPIDAVFSCLNAGTLVGAPKKKAMEIIHSLEKKEREFYGGNLLHVFPNGDTRATILIRTAVIKEDEFTIQAGATILHESDENFEYWECGAKARSLLTELEFENLCFKTGPAPEFVSSQTVINTRNFYGQPFQQSESNAPKKLLLIDNEDSFSFNLAALFSSLGCKIDVVRNNVTNINYSLYDGIILSPGPSSPADAGNLLEIVKTCAGKLPVFGVCLGFQAMVEALGGTLNRMKVPLHGKVRNVIKTTDSLSLHGIPDEFLAARYHSLYASRVPDTLKITAKDANNIPLAFEGPTHWPSFVGLQFHPESFLTGAPGIQIAKNWVETFK